MMLSLDFLAIPLLTAAGLVFLSLLAGMFSVRLGFSFLLVFLVAGMLLGEDGPGGVLFDDFRLAFWVGNTALAVILLDGGLRTRYPTFRTGLKPALWLATVGVVVCAVVTGLAARILLGLDWPLALLLGAIVGSTDAAAVFSLLKTSGVKLNERVAATLEIESGLNDPMAVYLTLALIGWSMATISAASVPVDGWQAIWALLLQFGWGAALGLGLGWALAVLLRANLPVAVGFGVKTPERAAQIARVADAVVAGSVLVDEVAAALDQNADPVSRVLDRVRSLADAVRGARATEKV